VLFLNEIKDIINCNSRLRREGRRVADVPEQREAGL
jgi:hypothetical protein